MKLNSFLYNLAIYLSLVLPWNYNIENRSFFRSFCRYKPSFSYARALLENFQRVYTPFLLIISVVFYKRDDSSRDFKKRFSHATN